MASFVVLLVVNVALSIYFWDSGSQTAMKSTADGNKTSPSHQYKSYQMFRNNYLLVYLAMMMADWLQGPYVYALYKSYNYDIDQIGVLFIAGFLSSAIFGTVISSMADRYGRKRMCLAFSVIYTLSCLTKFSPSFGILMVGRLFGGISTSLLFSVFEAWLVSEHHSRGYPEEWLSSTFSWATYGNGFIAILSGVIANVSVDITGSFIAPFVVSAVFLVFGGVVVLRTWSENYGESSITHLHSSPSSSASSNSPVSSGSPMSPLAIDDDKSHSSLVQGLIDIKNDVRVLFVGLIVSMFEGCMYTFVFLWGPVLEEDFGNKIPYGLIFATFMVCIMMGSIVFRWALSKHVAVEKIIQPILLLATVALFIPVISQNSSTYLAFNLFELCCGIYFPTMGTLRSKYVPEATRATIMNIFRVPLNLIVVVVLLNVSTMSYKVIFFICTVLMLLSFCCSLILHRKVVGYPRSQK